MTSEASRKSRSTSVRESDGRIPARLQASMRRGNWKDSGLVSADKVPALASG
jgi:hypothetical protein